MQKKVSLPNPIATFLEDCLRGFQETIRLSDGSEQVLTPVHTYILDMIYYFLSEHPPLPLGLSNTEEEKFQYTVEKRHHIQTGLEIVSRTYTKAPYCCFSYKSDQSELIVHALSDTKPQQPSDFTKLAPRPYSSLDAILSQIRDGSLFSYAKNVELPPFPESLCCTITALPYLSNVFIDDAGSIRVEPDIQALQKMLTSNPDESMGTNENRQKISTITTEPMIEAITYAYLLHLLSAMSEHIYKETDSLHIRLLAAVRIHETYQIVNILPEDTRINFLNKQILINDSSFSDLSQKADDFFKNFDPVNLSKETRIKTKQALEAIDPTLAIQALRAQSPYWQLYQKMNE